VIHRLPEGARFRTGINLIVAEKSDHVYLLVAVKTATGTELVRVVQDDRGAIDVMHERHPVGGDWSDARVCEFPPD
jgi:hypothetical protein